MQQSLKEWVRERESSELMSSMRSIAPQRKAVKCSMQFAVGGLVIIPKTKMLLNRAD